MEFPSIISNSKEELGMSSEILLHWLSSYPKSQITEQVIDRACYKIEVSQGRDVESKSKIRRKYLNPLVEFGNVEKLNETGTPKYSVSPTTLLQIDKKCTILCGYVDSNLVEFWNENFVNNQCQTELPFYYSDDLISDINYNLPTKLIVSKVNTLSILEILPQISTELFIEIEYQDITNFESFNTQNGKWQKTEIKQGVFRHSNLPPTVESWYLIKKNQSGYTFYTLNTTESTLLALCLIASIENKIILNYNSNTLELSIQMPKNVFLPLLLLRPLRWLDCSSGSISYWMRFKNISKNHIKEICRILKSKLMEV